MDWLTLLYPIFAIKLISSANVSTTATPHKNEDLKTSRSYQVTEKVVDIPDNRTLPPIAPSFGLLRPLNFGNNTIVVNNVVEQNSGVGGSQNGGENKTSNEGKLKKHSFSILHVKAEYDDTPVHKHQNVFKKVFGGIKDYVYNLKKGVVDGLHSFFHKNDDKSEESEFQDKPNTYDKFHRNLDGVEDFSDDNDYYDDESEEHFRH